MLFRSEVFYHMHIIRDGLLQSLTVSVGDYDHFSCDSKTELSQEERTLGIMYFWSKISDF